MQLVKGRKLVEDTYTLVRELDAQLPAGPVIVPVERWVAERDALLQRGDVGVLLGGADDPSVLADDVGTLELIAIDFPAFKDGRGYTHARMLRDRYGYEGELRAIGQILRDQIFYYARCGFDAFLIPEGKNALDVMKGLDDFTVTYQAAADEPAPIYRRHLISSAAE